MFKFSNVNVARFGFHKWGITMDNGGFRIDDVSKEDGFSLDISYNPLDQIMLLSIGLFYLAGGLATLGLIPGGVSYVFLPFILLWGAYNLIVRLIIHRILLNLAVFVYYKIRPEKFETTADGYMRLCVPSHS